MSARDDGATLLRRFSRSMFWNATLLPLISISNLVASVLLRRYFGLASGLYDLLIGAVTSLMFWASLGIPVAFTQFLPELEERADHGRARIFVRRAAALRLSILLLFLLLLNVFAAERVADHFGLGDNGVMLVRLVSLLALVRAANELVVKVLQSLLAHLAANGVQLAQAILGALSVALVLGAGRDIETLVAVLVVAGLLLLTGALPGLLRTLRHRGGKVSRAVATGGLLDPGVGRERFWRFAFFIYGHDWLNYVASPAFASLILGSLFADRGPIALFNTAFQFPMMTVVVMLAGFQGLYRPMFARLVIDAEPQRLRTAFAEVSKVQIALLLPAGVGLALVIGDVIPLLYGATFAPAVPLARVLCGFLFAEAIFNLGSIVLSVGHRYRAVYAAQAMRLLGVPLFVGFAARGELWLAAAGFGAGRLGAVLVGYAIARRELGVRFPVRFLSRALPPTLVMATVVIVGRALWPTSWAELAGVSLAGAAALLAAMKAFRMLGPRELDLIERAHLPGGSRIIGWLKPRPPRRPR